MTFKRVCGPIYIYIYIFHRAVALCDENMGTFPTCYGSFTHVRGAYMVSMRGILTVVWVHTLYLATWTHTNYRTPSTTLSALQASDVRNYHCDLSKVLVIWVPG